MTYLEGAEKYQAVLDAWLGSVDVAPPGGESMRAVQARVLAGLDRTLAAHSGKTIAVVSHVTPIKTLVSHAVNSPLDSLFRMELTPASVSVVSFHENRGRNRSEERRVGKECVSTCRSRWVPDH